MEMPLDCRDEWQRAMDDMFDLDLDADGDPTREVGLLRKRPDELAMNWGSKTVLILEFTRALDSRVDWHILVDLKNALLRRRLDQLCLTFLEGKDRQGKSGAQHLPLSAEPAGPARAAQEEHLVLQRNPTVCIAMIALQFSLYVNSECLYVISG